MGIMESEFSKQPERNDSDLRNQSSTELLRHVLNRFIPTEALDEIASIAAERDNTFKGEQARENDKLIDAVVIKIRERLTEKDDVAKLEKRFRFYAEDQRMTKSIFDGAHPKAEQVLKHLIEGLNPEGNDKK